NPSRRKHLKTLLAAAGGASLACLQPPAVLAGTSTADVPPPDHERRIEWWREAKFGMFVHWGLYSILGREAWVMGDEDIPLEEYEKLGHQFQPPRNVARAWAKLARESGMRYMVMTTKHHEGFCLFNSKLTPYCAPQLGPGRDLVQEYVDAARAEGLHVGFYYSLMDWHHPDWRVAKTDSAARKRFVDYTHSQLRELMTNYGKIDILWYDMPVPLDAEGWRSAEMNDMVLSLQPDILINNRNLLVGDFSTPEQSTAAAKNDWESCMTINDSWAYLAADNNWKSAQQLLQNLVECSRDGGNYLLDIGPRADGSLPEPAVERLRVIGAWLRRNGDAVYGTQRCRFPHGNIGVYTRKGNTLYAIVYFWPGSTMTVGGVRCKVKSARFLASGAPVKFEQKGSQLIFASLPEKPPDEPLNVIAAECDAEPVQDALSSKADPAA
ncbi:MAG TPA: alpha-L-fucosidase, partial [Candidatus Binatia bacterium]|nr:alpha-L-fucosidase [Candidatus Binatia bacterium]